jgi:hypothetical protein
MEKRYRRTIEEVSCRNLNLEQVKKRKKKKMEIC